MEGAACMKRIFLVRHCKAAGQGPEAPLVEEGTRQAQELAEFLDRMDIDYLIASPYRRAVDTIRPLSERLGKEIHTDERLIERVLSTGHLENWMECLEQTYEDFELKFQGGESSGEATARAIQVIQEAWDRPETSIVIVTHGALLSLIIKYYRKEFSFEDWKKLGNPDVYKLQMDTMEPFIERVKLP
jgi:2,3-bisphosphoglycerate-dependent phosphoglycerate mutase